MSPKPSKLREASGNLPTPVTPSNLLPRMPVSEVLDPFPEGRAASPKSRRLSIQLQPGETEDRAKASLVVQGLVGNASATAVFQSDDHGELALDDLIGALQASGRSVSGGDLAGLEQMLAAQSVTLNAIFTQLARRACLNMDSSRHLYAGEVYLRLALKAQSQSRAAIESLAAIKNPSVIIAKQMNVANGPQQINNQDAEFAPPRPPRKRTSAERTK